MLMPCPPADDTGSWRMDVHLNVDLGSMKSPGQVVVRVEVRNVVSWDSMQLREAMSRLVDYAACTDRCRFPRLGHGLGFVVVLFEMDSQWIDEAPIVAREIATAIGLGDDSFDSATIEIEDAALWRRDVFGTGMM